MQTQKLSLASLPKYEGVLYRTASAKSSYVRWQHNGKDLSSLTKPSHCDNLLRTVTPVSLSFRRL